MLTEKMLTVWVKKTQRGVAGRYYGFRQRPHIVARVGLEFPMKLHLYQYAQHVGQRHWLADREEAAVYVLAHECRHFWQQHSRLRNAPFPEGRGRVSTRGVFSEVDTEAYAIHKLREWRRGRMKGSRVAASLLTEESTREREVIK